MTPNPDRLTVNVDIVLDGKAIARVAARGEGGDDLPVITEYTVERDADGIARPVPKASGPTFDITDEARDRNRMGMLERGATGNLTDDELAKVEAFVREDMPRCRGTLVAPFEPIPNAVERNVDTLVDVLRTIRDACVDEGVTDSDRLAVIARDLQGERTRTILDAREPVALTLTGMPEGTHGSLAHALTVSGGSPTFLAEHLLKGRRLSPEQAAHIHTLVDTADTSGPIREWIHRDLLVDMLATRDAMGSDERPVTVHDWREFIDKRRPVHMTIEDVCVCILDPNRNVLLEPLTDAERDALLKPSAALELAQLRRVVAAWRANVSNVDALSQLQDIGDAILDGTDLPDMRVPADDLVPVLAFVMAQPAGVQGQTVFEAARRLAPHVGLTAPDPLEAGVWASDAIDPEVRNAGKVLTRYGFGGENPLGQRIEVLGIDRDTWRKRARILAVAVRDIRDAMSYPGEPGESVNAIAHHRLGLVQVALDPGAVSGAMFEALHDTADDTDGKPPWLAWASQPPSTDEVALERDELERSLARANARTLEVEADLAEHRAQHRTGLIDCPERRTLMAVYARLLEGRDKWPDDDGGFNPSERRGILAAEVIEVVDAERMVASATRGVMPGMTVDDALEHLADELLDVAAVAVRWHMAEVER